jgi:hypothetical protein
MSHLLPEPMCGRATCGSLERTNGGAVKVPVMEVYNSDGDIEAHWIIGGVSCAPWRIVRAMMVVVQNHRRRLGSTLRSPGKFLNGRVCLIWDLC